MRHSDLGYLGKCCRENSDKMRDMYRNRDKEGTCVQSKRKIEQRAVNEQQREAKKGE